MGEREALWPKTSRVSVAVFSNWGQGRMGRARKDGGKSRRGGQEEEG